MSEPEKTFDQDDKFERKIFAEKLTKVITRYAPLYDEAFVLSLNAPWGAGKTTFLEMWRSYLENQEEPYQVIHINAWETDFDEEPLIPIISAIYTHVSKTSISNELKKSILEVLGITALGINDVIAHAIGFDLRKVLSESEEENKSLQKVGEDLYKEYSFKKTAYDELRKALNMYVSGLGRQPLVIFVDELDRVRPDYAVKFLEAIKHIFSAKGVCFVIAVDKEQLKKSVKQLYGDIDFSNYYRRFITREANLPGISKIGVLAFLEKQLEVLLVEENGFKVPIKQGQQQSLVQFMSNLCRCFNFSPRQIEEWFRVFSHFIVVETDNVVFPGWLNASMLLIAISIDNPKLYNDIGKGVTSPSTIHDYLKSLDYSWEKKERTSGKSEFDLIRVAMAFYLNSNIKNEIADIYMKYTSIGGSNDSLDNKRLQAVSLLAGYVDEFGSVYDTSTFQSIYDRLEHWNKLTS